MNKIGFIKFRGHELVMYFDKYVNNDNTAIMLLDADTAEPYMVVSTNINKLEPREAYIKNYSENEGILEALVEQKIISEPKDTVRTGFTSVDLVDILVDPDGFNTFAVQHFQKKGITRG